MIRDAAQFAAGYELPTNGVPNDAVELILLLWGWWHWTVDQALLVVRACDRGDALAAVPIVRSAAEHAHAMVWLRDAGKAGIVAVHAANDASRRLLHERLTDEGAPPPELEPGPPHPDVRPEDVRRERALFADVQQRVGAYDGADPYSVYGLLSSYVHPTLLTARAFVRPGPGGGAEALSRVDREREETSREAGPVHAATALLVASQVLAAQLDDPRLADAVERWSDRFGYLPAVPRRRPVAEQSEVTPSTHEARRLGEALADVEDPRAAVDRLTSGQLPIGVNVQEAQRTVSRAAAAIERLAGWATGGWSLPEAGKDSVGGDGRSGP